MPQPGSRERAAVAWEARIERARVLGERFPAAREMLEFYAHLAEFQKSIARRLTPPVSDGRPVAFAAAADPAEWLTQFPALLDRVAKVGTPVLAAAASGLRDAGPAAWEPLLLSAWSSGGTAIAGDRQAAALFARALLQPYARAAAEAARPNASDAAAEGAAYPAGEKDLTSCPVCSGKPVAGVLRKEYLGAKRLLVCSFCLTEWEFLRVMCPNCREQDFEALPVFTAEPFDHVRIYACDTCRTYLKTVDLTKDGHAIPDVDELAAVPLSVWAQERGYTKLQSNLLDI